MKFAKILTLSILAFPIVATAEEPDTSGKEDSKGIFSLVVENDKFAGSDQDYTNGVRLAWSSSEKDTPDWANSVAHLLPIPSDANKRITLAVGQNMYTPADTATTLPQPNDHPYAGWLYGSIGVVADTGTTLDNVMLTLGVVGPMALGEEIQNGFHGLIGSEKSRGWDNQLDNEPGLILTYERKWKEFFELSALGMETDIMPHVGVNLGNINTDATVGGTLRLGFDLPEDYGPPRIRPSLPGSDFFVPSEDWGGYFFATVEERAVARNIFLDGNTFSDSLSVDKKNFVGSLQLGVATTYGDTRISYSQVFMTKEYETQQQASEFGTLTVSYRF